MISWCAGSDFAGYTLVAALVGRFMPAIRRLGRYALIPDGENRWAADWFVPLQSILTVIVTLLCVWIATDFRFIGVGQEGALLGLGGRAAGVTGLLMVLGATILMAAQAGNTIRQISPASPLRAPTEGWSGEGPGVRAWWQAAAFVVALLFMASIRFAGLDPQSEMIAAAPWLHRSIALLLSAAMMCMLTSFGLPQVSRRLWTPLFPTNPANPKRTWSDAGRKILPCFAGLTLAVLAIVLVQEGWLFDPQSGVTVSISETFVVAAVITAMLVLVLVFALRRDLDPLQLSDADRQAYVYAAEVLLALVGLHVWLTNPQLFHLGIIKKYWMFLIMFVAFAGAGLSEIFHRRKLPVLSLPLERTALLLPVLPVIGFWIITGELNWGLTDRTPWLWFLIAGFYGMMAQMRRSPVSAVLAVLSANMGIWIALRLGDISFFEHPQLWLIPIALCALVAEFMNRERLTKGQSTAFRYAALSTIYVSSTADMFIAGIGQNFWLPIVLMLLAVAGALVGVLLRIRSFLILGIIFLVIDILSLIWYAAVDLEQTWLWYVSFIALGAAIIAVFAFFEKRRNNVLAAVQKLRKWER